MGRMVPVIKFSGSGDCSQKTMRGGLRGDEDGFFSV